MRGGEEVGGEGVGGCVEALLEAPFVIYPLGSVTRITFKDHSVRLNTCAIME